MNQPQSNTILNGPTGELTMAFKEAQKPINNPNTPNNQNFRPQLQRNDSRVQGGPQIQGQPRPFQGQPVQQPGQAPQFRPPNFQQQLQQQLQQNQQQRFGPPGNQGPQGPQNQNLQGQPGQPLFRPQQRFVAVNPPGTVRHNFRPSGPGVPGTPGTQGLPNPQNQLGSQGPIRQRPPGPGLIQQQSFAGALPNQRQASQDSTGSGEFQRSATLEADTLPSINNSHEEKMEIKLPEVASTIAQPPIQPPQPPLPKVPTPEPTQNVTPSPQKNPSPILPPQQSPSPQPQQNAQSVPNTANASIVSNASNPGVDSAPPSTLKLTSALESKNSSSPSPQPETVVEVKSSPAKATKEKASAGDHKPPRVPKTPTRGGNTARTPSRNKKEGDNDSGVDESTQGADSTNGERTPRKSSRNGSRLPGGGTPTKHRSFSRGSRSPHLMSPDSQPGTPGPTTKKLPMNKIQVGSAPSPNLKVVKSKIGSLANASHKPGGGNVKIETKKIDVSKATSRIGAKNDTYTPTGGDKKIISQKLQWNAKSKIGSLDNANHKPKGGEKKIETVKLDFKDKAKPKVGSKDNIQHVPGGGEVKNHPQTSNGTLHCDVAKATKSAKDAKEAKEKHNESERSVKIIDRKIEIQAQSKIGSMDNVKHTPGGGEKKIFDDKEYLRQMSGGAMTNENNSVCGSQNKLRQEVENVVDKQKMLNVMAMMGKVVTILETVEENQRKILQSRPVSRNSQKSPKRRPVSTPRIPWRY